MSADDDLSTPFSVDDFKDLTLGELLGRAGPVPVLIRADSRERPYTVLVVSGQDCETLNLLMHHFTKEQNPC